MKRGTEDSKGKLICNFIPRPVSLDKVYLNAGRESVETVRFWLDFGDGNIENEKVFSFPLDDIDDIPWKKLDKRCNFDPDMSDKRIERYLGCIVRQALISVPERSVYKFNRVGMYTVDGRPVFYTGTKLILFSHSDTNIVFETEQTSQKLEVDEKLSEEEAAAEFFRLLCLSPDPGRVISAYKLGQFMSLAYEQTGRMPKNCIYLYGQSGTQKTTFSSFLVQTYDRSDGIKKASRLDASNPAAVNMLLENPNDVVVMDDLFPTDSPKKQRQMEETLIEITRYIADGTTPAKMEGKKLSRGYPRCGVIFTGEYLIGRGSDAARILPIKMVKPDIKKLRYFLEHPLIVSTFYYYFISWFIDRFEEVCVMLKEFWKVYENAKLNVHDRLRETYYFLGSSFFLFLQYLYEKGFISDSDAARLYQSFNELLNLLVTKQNERVKMGTPEQFENIDYWRKICELYRNKQFCTADSADNFDKNQHDSVLHDNCLYFRGECLSRFFPNISLKEIVDELERKGVLQAGRDKKTKQIFRLKGMRFYVIPLAYLT